MNRRLKALLDRLEPETRNAFLGAVQTVRDGVLIAALVQAISAGDVEAATRAVGMDRAVFNRYEGVLANAFATGGALGTDAVPAPLRRAAGVVVRFDVRNPRAEAWLARESSTLIEGIVSDQRDAIRKALTAGLEQGLNPRTVALDIAGRVENGRRVGGLVGLTSRQTDYAISARAELTQLDANYFTRQLRDKRFDATVKRAIADGKPLAQADIDRIVNRYSDRLLKHRGDNIGRTEAIRALHAGRLEGMKQGLERTNVSADMVTKVWRTASDERVRDSHVAMDGVEVQGLDTPFVLPSGFALAHPNDPAGPPEETINCRCSFEMRVDYSRGVE